MRSEDLGGLALGAVRGHPLRSALSMLGIAIGIAAVMLLTSIGEGARRFLVAEVSQFGTNVMAVNPGKTDTIGVPGVFGGTQRKLTIEDAEAIARLPGVQEVVPLVMAQARVEGNGRGRSVYIYGSTAALPGVWNFPIGQGRFLPDTDPRRGTSAAVLGPKLKRELFGDANPLGETVRIAGARLRVVGVMEPKGQFLGIDLDDSAYVSLATAMQLFNLDELLEIDVLFSHEGLTASVEAAVRKLLTERHGGREDFTITTQTAMLEVFGNVMDVVTVAVAAIGGISLLVGAIGVLTMMWIAVNERRSEIGLMRAVGATPAQVERLFLLEAVGLTVTGGAAGIALGLGVGLALRLFVPGMPVHTPIGFTVAALVVSAATGLAAGLLPARRAAALHPVEALRAE